MRSPSLFLPILASLILAVGAGATLWLEAKPFLDSGTSALQRVETAGGAPLTVGLSSFSHDMALTECREVLVDPLNRLLPAERRGALSRTCAATATDILSRSPTSAYAAFVAGYASALLEEEDGAVSKLALSQKLSPTAAWLAQLRLRALNEGFLTADAGDSGASADIQLLGALPGGRQWLAGWYAERPDARASILAAIEALPVESQRAFLSAVRRRAS